MSSGYGYASTYRHLPTRGGKSITTVSTFLTPVPTIVISTTLKGFTEFYILGMNIVLSLADYKGEVPPL